MKNLKLNILQVNFSPNYRHFCNIIKDDPCNIFYPCSVTYS